MQTQVANWLALLRTLVATFVRSRIALATGRYYLRYWLDYCYLVEFVDCLKLSSLCWLCLSQMRLAVVAVAVAASVRRYLLGCSYRIATSEFDSCWSSERAVEFVFGMFLLICVYVCECECVS